MVCGRLPDAQHVARADLFDVHFGVAALEQDTQQIWVLRYVLETGRQGVAHAIEIRSETDMLDTYQVFDVIDVIGHLLDSREFRRVRSPEFVDDGLGLLVAEVEPLLFEQRFELLESRALPFCPSSSMKPEPKLI